MQVSSNDYSECDIFSRTIIQIEYNDKNNHNEDIFRILRGNFNIMVQIIFLNKFRFKIYIFL